MRLMARYATKEYVDEELDRKVAHQFGLLQEYFDDNFQIIREELEGIKENHERFELETSRKLKFIENRLNDVS